MLPLLAAALSWASPAGTGAIEPTAEPPASAAFPGAEPTSAERLEQATARDLAVVAQCRQAATVASSSVNGTSTTGEAAIAGQAFQNASGLTLVNINTGNNVAMNASMNVNVVVNPQP